MPRLKQASPSVEEGSPTDVEASGRGSGTVLLVEDEDVVRRLAAKALRRAGYTVREARDGTEALRLLEAQDGPVDLLFTGAVP